MFGALALQNSIAAYLNCVYFVNHTGGGGGIDWPLSIKFAEIKGSKRFTRSQNCLLLGLNEYQTVVKYDDTVRAALTLQCYCPAASAGAIGVVA